MNFLFLLSIQDNEESNGTKYIKRVQYCRYIFIGKKNHGTTDLALNGKNEKKISFQQNNLHAVYVCI